MVRMSNEFRRVLAKHKATAAAAVGGGGTPTTVHFSSGFFKSQNLPLI